jgi:hypothetical protein
MPRSCATSAIWRGRFAGNKKREKTLAEMTIEEI